MNDHRREILRRKFIRQTEYDIRDLLREYDGDGDGHIAFWPPRRPGAGRPNR